MNVGIFGGLTDAGFGELLNLGLKLDPGLVKILSLVLFLLGLYGVSLAIKDRKIRLAVILTLLLSIQSLSFIYATYSLLVPTLFFVMGFLYLGFEIISKGKFDKKSNENKIFSMDIMKYRIFLVVSLILILAYGWFSHKLFDMSSLFANWQNIIIYSLPLLLSIISFTEPKHHERLPIWDKIFSFLISLFALFIDPILSLIVLIQLIKESYHVIFYSKTFTRQRNQFLLLVFILTFWAAYAFTNNIATSLSWGVFGALLVYIFIFAVSFDLNKADKYTIYGSALLMFFVFVVSMFPTLAIQMPSNYEIAMFSAYPNSYILGHPNAYAYYSGLKPIIFDPNNLLESQSDFNTYIQNISKISKSSVRKYFVIYLPELYNKMKESRHIFKVLKSREVSNGGTINREVLYGNKKYMFLMYLDSNMTPLNYDIQLGSKSGYSQTIPFTKIVPLNAKLGYLNYVANIDGIEDSVLYDWILHKKPINNQTGEVLVYEYQ